MGNVRLYGSTSGYTELAPPAVAPDGVLSLPSGTGTIAKTTDQGLVHINTTTFTAVSSVSLNNVFTSDYENYRIVLSRNSSAGDYLSMRLRSSGVDTTSADYDYIRVFVYGSGTVAGFRGLSDTSWSLGYYPTVRIGNCSADIYGPNLAASSQYAATGGSGQELTTLMGELDLATSYDGFTLIPSAGNMTGNISVYGYKNGA